MNNLRELENALGVECYLPRTLTADLSGQWEDVAWLVLPYALLTFYCDCMSFMCQWINTNQWLCILFYLLSLSIIHLLLFTTKTFTVQVFFSKCKLFLVVNFQCCSVYYLMIICCVFHYLQGIFYIFQHADNRELALIYHFVVVRRNPQMGPMSGD